MRMPTLALLPAAFALVVALSACDAATVATAPAGKAISPGGAATAGAPGESTAAGAPEGSATDGGGQAPEGYEGSLVTSGLYDAAWTVSPEAQTDPFNSVAGHTLISDKGTFGNVTVQPDGSISFGSGAPELSSHGLAYTGTGASVTLDETGGFVCAFTVDTDLASDDGTTLRVAGSLTVHWHPEGLGGLNCP